MGDQKKIPTCLAEIVGPGHTSNGMLAADFPGPHFQMVSVTAPCCLRVWLSGLQHEASHACITYSWVPAQLHAETRSYVKTCEKCDSFLYHRSATHHSHTCKWHQWHGLWFETARKRGVINKYNMHVVYREEQWRKMTSTGWLLEGAWGSQSSQAQWRSFHLIPSYISLIPRSRRITPRSRLCSTTDIDQKPFCKATTSHCQCLRPVWPNPYRGHRHRRARWQTLEMFLVGKKNWKQVVNLVGKKVYQKRCLV